MAFALDPQVATAMEPLLAAAGDQLPPAAGDWKTRRANVEGLMGLLADLQPRVTDVLTTDHSLTTEDGATIGLRWYTGRVAPRGRRSATSTAAG